MLKFNSEQQLRHATLAVTLALASLAAFFYFLQNHIRLVGGEIAFSKLVWLTFAILFWLALPLLILMDFRTPAIYGRIFKFLLALMLLRGVAELIMLYIFNNWLPIYGISHDAVCLAGMALLLIQARNKFDQRSHNHNPTLLIHGIVTAMMFIPEIYFAWYMSTHFDTQGKQAVYFVPDSAGHRDVLLVTSCVNIFLTIYFPIFVRNWLHGKAFSKRN